METQDRIDTFFIPWEIIKTRIKLLDFYFRAISYKYKKIFFIIIGREVGMVPRQYSWQTEEERINWEVCSRSIWHKNIRINNQQEKIKQNYLYSYEKEKILKSYDIPGISTLPDYILPKRLRLNYDYFTNVEFHERFTKVGTRLGLCTNKLG